MTVGVEGSPEPACALLFLRKANLAFEIDRVLRLPKPQGETELVSTNAIRSLDQGDSVAADAMPPPQAPSEACR